MDYYSFKQEIAELLNDPFSPAKDEISVKWIAGGVSGGDCWGGEADLPRTPELEPELLDLDKIITKFAPNMSYLKYKNYKKLIERDECYQKEFEYYGNSCIYGKKSIDLHKLFDLLVKDGFIK